ncbi:hypothetical protein C4N9_00130 [Pararhodobacter marinus]|uniref:DUF1468 domain-containing protein n=1 Tax=Pararhodobacter marinus TaxID=2184063 RepID=A0A2U2CHV9_9RHOB|nr:tripartite tricarboxylate transporter TctB family protein [Pararhodobacter marinus]PWE31473.1 hypothetical protein C4N9_00130 [Pararhodobacter marinus]
MLQRLTTRDTLGGLLMIALGLAAAVIGRGYDLGTLRQMGAGWFPVALGILLAVLGLGVILTGRPGHSVPAQDAPAQETALTPETADRNALQTDGDGSAGPSPLRSLFFVLASIGAFALLIPILGLILTVPISVGLASMADPKSRPVPVLLLGLGLAALTSAIFVLGLGLQMDLLP